MGVLQQWMVAVKTPPGASLLSGLISYWQFDESSGTRNDAHGTNNLTDVNTVTSAAGLISSAAVFNAANSEMLTRASNASLQTGDIDFTFAVWVYPTAAANQIIITKGYPTAGMEYWLRVDSSGAAQFYVSDNGSSYVDVHTDAAEVAQNAWSFIVAAHNSIDDRITIQVNGGTEYALAYDLGLTADNAPLIFGAHDLGLGEYYTGRMDLPGFWKRLLTVPELAMLYNAGAGVAYPF